MRQTIKGKRIWTCHRCGFQMEGEGGRVHRCDSTAFGDDPEAEANPDYSDENWAASLLALRREWNRIARREDRGVPNPYPNMRECEP
jgi:hypothetical protein